MWLSVLFACVCANSGLVSGQFQITSGNQGSIAETHLNFLLVNVTTNVDTIQVPTGETNVVEFRVMSQSPNDPENAFNFWRNSSELRNRVTFDYESHQQYTVVIEAEPHFGTTATQTLTVDILDENEGQRWTFPGPDAHYKISLTDGDTNDADILTVDCQDEDNGQTLSFTLDDNRNVFAISSTGIIGLASGVTVNRAEFASVNYMYSIGIIATDNGAPPVSTTATASVTVNSMATTTDQTNAANAIFSVTAVFFVSSLIVLL